MDFDKEIFNKHFGQRYYKCYHVSIILFLIALFVFILLIVLPITINFILGILIGLIMVISAFLTPIFICAYKRRLEQSKRQHIWFEDNKLFVELIPDDGWTWGFVEKHIKKYEVLSIQKINTNNEYIKICGKVVFCDDFNGNIDVKEVNFVKIPRNFTNEEQIIRLEKTTYGYK